MTGDDFLVICVGCLLFMLFNVEIVVFAFHHGVAILVFCTFALEVFDIRLTFIINPPAPFLFGCKGEGIENQLVAKLEVKTPHCFSTKKQRSVVNELISILSLLHEKLRTFHCFYCIYCLPLQIVAVVV